ARLRPRAGLAPHPGPAGETLRARSALRDRAAGADLHAPRGVLVLEADGRLLAGRAPLAPTKREPRQDLADDPVGDERRDVGRTGRCRDHFDDLAADELQPLGGGAAGP